MANLRDDIAALRFDDDLRERKHFTQEAYHGYCEAVDDVLGLLDKNEAWVYCDECNEKASDLSAIAHHKLFTHSKPSDERSCKIVPGICETHFLEESGCPKPSDERPARKALFIARERAPVDYGAAYETVAAVAARALIEAIEALTTAVKAQKGQP